LLYNPGGFAEEFRALRLSPLLAMLLLAGMLLGPSIGVQMAMLAPICSVPLVFAGAALVHGLVAEADVPVLAGGALCHAGAVHAVGLSVTGRNGHCRQSV